MKTNRISESQRIWDRVFPSSPNHTPFLSYEWFSSLATHLLKSDPDVLVFYSEDTPVAILPAFQKDEKFTFIADERVTDLCDLLCISNYEEEVARTFGSMITSKGWQIDLFPLQEKSLLLKYVPEEVKGAKIVDADLSPFLVLPDSWEEYLSGLSGKQRHELRRKLRKAEQVVLKDASAEQLEQLFELMAGSSDEKKEFLSEQMRAFFTAIAHAFSKKGWLRFKVACSGNDVIGAILSFYHNRYVYLYNTGFDSEHAVLSPGIVTIALDIRDSIEAGDHCYDFLRGEERFKFNLGAQKRFMKRILC
jgi:CelD/BcsL family acetyltransferase involved in cellulose biosynthesis